VYSISGSTNPDDWGLVPNWNNVTWNAAVCDWNADGYRLPRKQNGSMPLAVLQIVPIISIVARILLMTWLGIMRIPMTIRIPWETNLPMGLEYTI